MVAIVKSEIKGGKGGKSVDKIAKPPSKASTNGISSGATRPSKLKETNTKRTTHSFHVPSPLSLPLCLALAICSFILGIICPPVAKLFVNRKAISAKDTHLSRQTAATRSAPLKRTACTSENLANYLHDQPVPGLHIVCLTPSTSSTSLLNVTMYLGSCCTDDDIVVDKEHKLEETMVEGEWPVIRKLLEEQLDLIGGGHDGRSTNAKWAMYTPRGTRLAASNITPKRGASVLDKLVQSEMLIVVAGGAWIWPGIQVGFAREVSLTDESNPLSIQEDKSEDFSTAGTSHGPDSVTIKTLSLSPLVLSVENFLTVEECDHIQKKASPMMEYSGVSLMDKDKGEAAANWRTSRTAFVNSDGDEVLHRIEDRVAMLTRIRRTHQEFLQVLRYGLGERYTSHHDFFDPEYYRGSDDVMELTNNGDRNRHATVFWYLSDVEEGGETIFPSEGGVDRNLRNDDCSVGLKVKPKKGKVIIFYSLLADGSFDEFSLHGACPVAKGTKWAANKWIWSEEMQFVK